MDCDKDCVGCLIECGRKEDVVIVGIGSSKKGRIVDEDEFESTDRRVI